MKWICGFANAEGGVLVIGRDDTGQVVGVKNARKLLEDIPNKVRDILGIIVEVNLKIKVFADRLKVWNPAVLPDGWDLAKLLGDHASHPFNPDIANAFFRAGEIESWGRGIHRIFEARRIYTPLRVGDRLYLLFEPYTVAADAWGTIIISPAKYETSKQPTL